MCSSRVSHDKIFFSLIIIFQFSSFHGNIKTRLQVESGMCSIFVFKSTLPLVRFENNHLYPSFFRTFSLILAPLVLTLAEILSEKDIRHSTANIFKWTCETTRRRSTQIETTVSAFSFEFSRNRKWYVAKIANSNNNEPKLLWKISDADANSFIAIEKQQKTHNSFMAHK